MAAVSFAQPLDSSQSSFDPPPESPAFDHSWSDYNLQWLYDPDRYDHLPVEDQLKYFQQRDLKRTKFYKTAVKIFDIPHTRKRVIYAQKVDSHQENSSTWGRGQPISSQLKPNVLPEKQPSPAEVRGREERKKLDDYHDWVSERKAFRKNLDGMGLNEEWLARKPNKTALEQRVLARLVEERMERPPSPKPPDVSALEPRLPDESPIVRRPSPQAIKVIERFLQRNKMRLIDLFKTVDKRKTWMVSRDEFRDAIKKARIPLSDALLEDLILTLDIDLNNRLDYRELAKGMELWKAEKRQTKQQLVRSRDVAASPTKYSQMNGFENPEMEDDEEKSTSPTKFYPQAGGKSTSPTQDPLTQDLPTQELPTEDMPAEDMPTEPLPAEDPAASDRPRVKSAVSGRSSGSSQYLEPPDSDLRPEQMLLSSEEAMVDLRKRDREALRRLTGQNKAKRQANVDQKTMIKTGDAQADRHMMPSSLGGEVGERVDRFRQQKFQEYHEVCCLCEERHLLLSENLLKKVLLYPPDKPNKELKRRLRQPSMELHSRHFADPPVTRRAKSPLPAEIQARAKAARAAKTSKTLVDSRTAYPEGSRVSKGPQKMHLSTGRAHVGKQVDCWMTFEEYDRLTRHLAVRYTQLHGTVDENAFWPGHLLDKLRLCMNDNTPKSSAVFTIADGRYKPRTSVPL